MGRGDLSSMMCFVQGCSDGLPGFSYQTTRLAALAVPSRSILPSRLKSAARMVRVSATSASITYLVHSFASFDLPGFLNQTNRFPLLQLEAATSSQPVPSRSARTTSYAPGSPPLVITCRCQALSFWG